LATEDEKERKEEKEIYIPVSIHKLMSRNKKRRSTIFSQETKALAKDLFLDTISISIMLLIHSN